jgi:hypothetical protein
MSLVADALALFLAMVLVASAVQKFVQPQRLGAAAARLAGVRQAYGPLLARMAAAVEFMAASALVFPVVRFEGALAALALWSTYAVLAGRAAARGGVFDCGCTLFRPKSIAASPSALSPGLLAAIAAGLLMLPESTGVEPQAFLAAATLLCLRFAAEEIAAARRAIQKAQTA